MLIKNITYEGFDGEEITEKHHFHLDKAEMAEIEIVTPGGVEAHFKSLLKAGNKAGVLELFKSVIRKSYGELDPANPRKFIKTPEIQDEFMNSGAFRQLYFELMTDAEVGKEFISGIMPRSTAKNPQFIADINKTYSEEIQALSAEPAESTPVKEISLPDDTKAWPKNSGEQPPDTASYLSNPRDDDGNLLPWAFREPDQAELTNMSRPQMMDVFRRKNTDWKPFAVQS